MSKYIELLLLLLPCALSDLFRMEVPLLPILVLCPAAAAAEFIFFGLGTLDAIIGIPQELSRILWTSQGAVISTGFWLRGDSKCSRAIPG